MKRHILLSAFLLFFASFLLQNHLFAQRNKHTLRVCFYNVENLFDCKDDSLTNDDTFTPEGNNHWTENRLRLKINNIAKTLIAIGEWDTPDIIGMAEVENAQVLHLLINETPLVAQPYSFVHYESPDRRGIDVALLYKTSTFTVIYSEPIAVNFPNDNYSKTRDILYVKGIAPKSKDTLHIFVNHWPSRYGGYAETIHKRNYTADLLRSKIDSICKVQSDAKIICMGDFNDYPYDESICEHLRAFAPDKVQSNDLIHTLFPYFTKNNIGTHKYQQEWGILDHLIVNQNLYYATTGFHTEESGHIFDADFLLTDDNTNMGKKTFRTYTGLSYSGGFSDHLPVYIDIKY